MDRSKILIVDDHRILRETMRYFLRDYDDIEIIGEAADGKSAIEKATELSPDIVIMDISMPNMDGLEATRYINNKIPNTKVIMLTQYGEKEYIQKSHQVGAAGYVSKTAMAKELVSTIRAIRDGHSFLYSILLVQN